MYTWPNEPAPAERYICSFQNTNEHDNYNLNISENITTFLCFIIAKGYLITAITYFITAITYFITAIAYLITAKRYFIIAKGYLITAITYLIIAKRYFIIAKDYLINYVYGFTFWDSYKKNSDCIDYNRCWFLLV